MQPTQPAWYCLRTQQKREHIVAANLRRLEGIEVYNPEIPVPRRAAHGLVCVLEPLFPGYLFARFALQPLLELVRFTPGVKHLVTFGGHWPTISEVEIQNLRDALKERESGNSFSGFDRGDEVEVLDGPFAGLSAVVQQPMTASRRVRLLLEVLGRATCVDMPAAGLRATCPYPKDLILVNTGAVKRAVQRTPAAT